MQRGVDLSGARVTYENLMSDACVITRNTGGIADDFYDEETRGLSAPGDDGTRVYDQTAVGTDGRSLAHETAPGGICIVFQAPEVALRPVDPASAEIPRRYRGSLPWDGPRPQVNDIWRMVFAANDPGLVDMRLIVRDSVHATFSVSQQVILEEFTSARP